MTGKTLAVAVLFTVRHIYPCELKPLLWRDMVIETDEGKVQGKLINKFQHFFNLFSITHTIMMNTDD